MTKRTIAAHKGNRDKRLEVRCTQETLDQIAAIIAARNRFNGGKAFTVADWIAEKAAEEFARTAIN